MTRTFLRLFAAGFSVVLFFLLLLPFSIYAQPLPAPGDLVINEVHYAPAPSTNGFIEVLNRTGRPVRLDGVTYADANQNPDPLAPSGTVLPPDSVFVVVRDPDAFVEAFPRVSFHAPSGWEGLNNGGDRVELVRDGRVLDAVVYDGDWADDRSLERIDPAGPSAETNFASSLAPAGATPGRVNSVYNPDRTPPVVLRASAVPTADTLLAVFSEALDPNTLSLGSADLRPTGTIVDVRVREDDPARVRLPLAAPLPSGSYTVTMQSVADLRGNVQPETSVALDVFRPDPAAPGDLVINEFMPDPDESGEWVELLNTSDKTFDLRLVTWTDGRADPVRVSPAPTPVGPGAYVLLVDDRDAFIAAYPDAAEPPNVGVLDLPDWPALNNGGDAPTVRVAGQVIDRVTYDGGWGRGDGVSLERLDPNGPSAAFNFADSPAGTTPGARNAAYAPDRSPPRLLFADEPQAGTLALFFDEPLDAASVARLVVESNGQTATQVDRTGAAELQASFDQPVGGEVIVTGAADRTGNVTVNARRDIARRPAAGDIVINELLPAPRQDAYDALPDQTEYVELYNRSAQRLTLRGLHLTDRPDETGVADTLWVGANVALPTGGYAVLFAGDDASTLHAAFPGSARDQGVFIPMQRNSLGLGNREGRVVVHRAGRGVLDVVDYTDDWHVDALSDARGTALARISPSGPSDADDNWTSSSAPPGGTPGSANAVSLVTTESPDAAGVTVTPSPFSPARDGATRIQYRLDAAPQMVRVRIFDALGRRVRTLNEAMLAGPTGEVVWNGRGDAGETLRVGVYVVLFEAVNADAGTVATYKVPVVLGRALR